ncbi:Gfo/Idh/MocA family oxidoreductase [Sphingomonas sp. PL-96]|uniref:Gfo/Idh/MocA family protein n=1 Tax=Sphingomonas sp. PL-96 TaxID=2887201 RepID=UPI001E473097|nr:Gfo/Idh/MocA family oxidoreductase [Sphingomonas sp. PL-96]MCC2978387.1 Gfo/Idh/MocA family oxidoreductase [Sphingomonas sp. PL-96]
MRVLMIGLGDIARKAYLPVLTTMAGLEIHLVTRDATVLEELGTRYRLAHRHQSLDAALEGTAFDAAFVHAATPAHPALVEALLHRGVPVMVDKPLADNLNDAERLVALAERQKVLLTVGFNRRFAPDYAALRDRPRTLVLMQKHRHAQPAAIRQTVFDDFIHVADTLRFLAPTPVQHEQIDTLVRDGLLEAITLTLRGDGYRAIGIMHRASGLDEETLDILGGDRRHSVHDLSSRVECDGAERRSRRGDWTSVGRQRGFEAMCTHFLDAVRAGHPTAAEDLLETHRLCERIVRHAQPS